MVIAHTVSYGWCHSLQLTSKQQIEKAIKKGKPSNETVLKCAL